MKRRRLSVQLSEQQQMIVAVLLVILVAVSVLYCLGFASTVVLQNWEAGTLPLDENGLFPDDGATASTVPMLTPVPEATPVP